MQLKEQQSEMDFCSSMIRCRCVLPYFLQRTIHNQMVFDHLHAGGSLTKMVLSSMRGFVTARLTNKSPMPVTCCMVTVHHHISP